MPRTKTGRATLRVSVTDVRGKPLADAAVELRRGEKVSALRVDDATGAFVADAAPVGEVVLAVSHPELESQERAVTLGQGSNEHVFLLGAPGAKCYFRERVRVPVDADPELIAITLDRQARGQARDIDAFARELRLEPQRVSALATRAGVHLYRVTSGELEQALEQLGRRREVEHAGAVVSMRKTGFSHMTNDVVVRLRRSTTDAARDLAAEHDLELTRELPYAPSTFVFRSRRAATLELLDRIAEIAARDDVEWAEPSLVVTPELDAVIPTDALWAGLLGPPADRHAECVAEPPGRRARDLRRP